MADLLQASAEAGGEQIEIVPHLARRIHELAVRQEQRAGEIIVQADATDLVGFGRAEAGNPVDDGCRMELRDLERDLEMASRRRQIGVSA